MPNTILIRGARQLLTMRGPKGPRRGPALNELSIIPDGALLIRDGTLVEVGSSRRVENLAARLGARQVFQRDGGQGVRPRRRGHHGTSQGNAAIRRHWALGIGH